jgi:hypothetical protein
MPVDTPARLSAFISRLAANANEQRSSAAKLLAAIYDVAKAGVVFQSYEAVANLLVDLVRPE